MSDIVVAARSFVANEPATSADALILDMADEIERLREACRRARIHVPLIRLAPERRYTMKVLDDALDITNGQSAPVKRAT